MQAESDLSEQRGASHDGRSAKDQLRCLLGESSAGNPDGLKDREFFRGESRGTNKLALETTEK